MKTALIVAFVLGLLIGAALGYFLCALLSMGRDDG